LTSICFASEAPSQQSITTQTNSNSLIKLAPANVLSQNITDIGMAHFLEKTELHTQLGGQTKHNLGIDAVIEGSKYDYLEYLNKSINGPMLNILKTQLMMHSSLLKEAILKGSTPVTKDNDSKSN
jgi:hypothetical protein